MINPLTLARVSHELLSSVDARRVIDWASEVPDVYLEYADPQIDIAQESVPDCSICLQPILLERGNRSIQNPVVFHAPSAHCDVQLKRPGHAHPMHLACVRPWMILRGGCPSCRKYVIMPLTNSEKANAVFAEFKRCTLPLATLIGCIAFVESRMASDIRMLKPLGVTELSLATMLSDTQLAAALVFEEVLLMFFLGRGFLHRMDRVVAPCLGAVAGGMGGPLNPLRLVILSIEESIFYDAILRDPYELPRDRCSRLCKEVLIAGLQTGITAAAARAAGPKGAVVAGAVAAGIGAKSRKISTERAVVIALCVALFAHLSLLYFSVSEETEYQKLI